MKKKMKQPMPPKGMTHKMPGGMMMTDAEMKAMMGKRKGKK